MTFTTLYAAVEPDPDDILASLDDRIPYEHLVDGMTRLYAFVDSEVSRDAGCELLCCACGTSDRHELLIVCDYCACPVHPPCYSADPMLTLWCTPSHSHRRWVCGLCLSNVFRQTARSTLMKMHRFGPSRERAAHASSVKRRVIEGARQYAGQNGVPEPVFRCWEKRYERELQALWKTYCSAGS